MNDAMPAGIQRGWVMLWNMGLTALLAAIGTGSWCGSFGEVVTSIRRNGL